MSDRPEMLLLEIPIRDGAKVGLHFPVDITADEAAKIARVIIAYADQPEGDER